MPEIIISDTSCLIILSNIGELEILNRTYRSITTTPEVASEYKHPLPEWIKITIPINKQKQKELELQLDKGEASAITLAIETPNSTLILDDYKARIIATQLGLEITGTLGVIVKAKNKGIIKSIKPYLEKLKSTNFRLSEELENEALNEAGEQ
ncbi:MAG: DUF3368 domain-containing protein [Chlorobi bacterium]|nr:DUF3368 domain-containing protein [Chlorobiota bacterium]MCI0714878.1 DUF3368 domain-containing protein [Chlorobiota bacterium]